MTPDDRSNGWWVLACVLILWVAFTVAWVWSTHG